MNKIKHITAAFIFILFASCSDDNKNNPSNGNQNTRFDTEVTVQTENGKSISFNYAFSYYDYEDERTYAYFSEDFIDEPEDINSMDNVLIILFNGTSEGSYDLSDNHEDNSVVLYTDNSYFISTEGAIEVLNYPQPGGTLSFKINTSLKSSGNTISLNSDVIDVRFFHQDDLDDFVEDDDDNDDSDDKENQHTDKYNKNQHSDIVEFKLKLDGRSYNDEYVYIYDVNAFWASYETDEDVSAIVFESSHLDEKYFLFNLMFAGNEPKLYDFENDSFALQISLYDEEYSSISTMLRAGSLNLKKFGSVGDVIEIEFNGTLQIIGMDEQIDIKEGYIKVVRGA